ncbi:MAG: heme ABC exporter ATP-binding protein CcmA [Terriglobia bacterium]
MPQARQSLSASASPRITLRALSKFYGRTAALDRLSLTFEPGEFVVLLGRNGAGKTTLLRTLGLLLRPSEGELLFDGRPVTAFDSSLKRRLGFVGHESFLYDELTAEENLLFYARLYGLARPRERIAEVLAAMELEDRTHALVRNLSRGLKQRLALARAWLHEPDVLLLDEPATGLDAPTRRRMHQWLARCHQTGRTVLVSSHDLAESLRPATRVLLLESGRLLFDGPNTPERAQEMLARLEAAAL